MHHKHLLLPLLGFSIAFCSASTLSASNGHIPVVLRKPGDHAKDIGLSADELQKFGCILSEISEDDNNSPKSTLEVKSVAKVTTPHKQAVEVNTFIGPNVEFHWKPQKDAKKVTMCGSWTGWKDHYNLSRNLQSGLYEVVVADIPNGDHQFKVKNTRNPLNV